MKSYLEDQIAEHRREEERYRNLAQRAEHEHDTWDAAECTRKANDHARSRRRLEASLEAVR